jgi:hypothetical protein
MSPQLPRGFGALLLASVLASVLHAQATSPLASSPWCGNVSATSATVAVHLGSSAQNVRLVVAVGADLSSAQYSAVAVTAAETGNVVKLDVQGLMPDSDYYYGIEVNGVLRGEANSRGRFHTFPLGAASFKIAFASCGDFRASNQSAYDAIVAEHPLLFINTGDLQYSDTNSTNVADYRQNYDSVLTQPNQAALYRSMPVAYMWDDHDYCGNDSDGTSVGRDTARRVYNEFVPHYPYTVSSGPIAQAFTIGRVRVIMTDTRSAASPHDQLDNAAKTHLGDAQKAWFKQELIAARDADFPLILWVSTTPWVGAADKGDDDWTVYAEERREIANFIKANRIKNLTMLCGDMHAIAYDDGSHSDYADGGGAPLVVLQAATLTQGGTVKGGPYTGGPIPGTAQYGTLEVTDNGGSTVSCVYSGKRVGSGTLLSYTFTGQTSVTKSPTPSASTTDDRALTAISTRTHIDNADDVVILGFVVSGRNPRTVVVRAVGPTLKDYGVSDYLPDPKLRLYLGGTAIAENDDWGTGNISQITAAFGRAGLTPFSSQTSKDAALVITLPPGVYTAQVRSVDGRAGTTLVEVYDAP